MLHQSLKVLSPSIITNFLVSCLTVLPPHVHSHTHTLRIYLTGCWLMGLHHEREKYLAVFLWLAVDIVLCRYTFTPHPPINPSPFFFFAHVQLIVIVQLVSVYTYALTLHLAWCYIHTGVCLHTVCCHSEKVQKTLPLQKRPLALSGTHTKEGSSVTVLSGFLEFYLLLFAPYC